ncbi:MAG: family N-acetyltransferase [Flaviaesturariibacter sp.]|nr:family N-acetyltransferase [Flaviaesturariibacter sp.]
MNIDTSLLSGSFVTLDILKPEDLPALRLLARDGRIWEYTKTLLINDTYDEQFDSYAAAALDPRNTGGQVSFVMRETATGELMGMTRYYRLEPAHKRVSIGYTWYAPTWWGRVHNKECKLLLLQYAFETLGFQRVEFEVAHQNLRSQKAVAKIGGVKEAVLRKHGLHADGTVRDTVVFSVIDDEWPSVKANLQALVAAGDRAAEKAR